MVCRTEQYIWQHSYFAKRKFSTLLVACYMVEVQLLRERERETLSMWFLVRTVKKIRRGLTWNPLPAFHKQLVLLLSSSTVLLLLYSQTCLIVSLPLFFFLLSVWGFLTSFVSLQSMFHGFHSSSSSTMFSNSLFSPLFHDHFISCMRFHEISMKYYFLWLVLARL